MNSTIKLSIQQLTTEDLRPGRRLSTFPWEERIRQIAKSIALAGVVSMTATAGSAVAAPLPLTPIAFLPVPVDQTANMQPGGAFSAFDISFVDPVTGNYFVADRSNAAVDIYSGSTLAFLGRATGFTGQKATTSVSGPDGVLTVTTTSGGITNTTLYAGDGNSTLKIFNASNPMAPTVAQAPISTGGNFRVDEMAFSPATGQILAANNADAPAYGNLFSTTGGHPPVTLGASPIPVPTIQGGFANGGMEQPVWNPHTGTFFVSIPQLTIGGASDPGGVAQINTSGTVLNTFSFAGQAGISAAGCSPSGLALGASGNMLVGCNVVGGAAVMVHVTPGTGGNPATLSILKTFPGLGGTDEIWFDPTTNSFYVTGNSSSTTNTGKFFAVVSDMGSASTITQTIGLPTTISAHSIAVDPFNGDVFVPLAGNLAVNPCPTSLGCIEVFAPTPLPTALPLLATGLGALGLLGWRRKRKAATAALA